MISVDFYGVDFTTFGCGVDNVDATGSGDDVSHKWDLYSLCLDVLDMMPQ